MSTQIKYTHVHAHARTRTRTHTQTHKHTNTQTHTHKHTHTHTHAHTHKHTNTHKQTMRTRTHTRVHTHMNCAHAHEHAHALTHAQTHAHTHTHEQEVVEAVKCEGCQWSAERAIARGNGTAATAQARQSPRHHLPADFEIIFTCGHTFCERCAEAGYSEASECPRCGKGGAQPRVGVAVERAAIVVKGGGVKRARVGSVVEGLRKAGGDISSHQHMWHMVLSRAPPFSTHQREREIERYACAHAHTRTHMY